MSDLSLRCAICQGMLDEEDVFCGNCGTEAPAPEHAEHSTARTATHNFQCGGCGAAMSYDPTAGALRCPFCGSVDLQPQPDRKVLAPSRVVPFAVAREAAVSTLRTWLGQGFWRPSDLSEQALVVKMAPVYVPYWVFSAQTHTHWTADTSDVPWGSQGDWRPLAGEHQGEHAGLLVGASGALVPAETTALCPFDLSAGVAPEEVDLERATIEQFSLLRKYARPHARQALEQLDAADCQARYVPGRARNLRVNVLVSGQTSEPVLLPVWIMAYGYRDRTFRFLINGQTGQATGQAPLSKRKILAAALAAAGALLLLVLLFALMR